MGGRHQPGPNQGRGNRIRNHLGPRELGETQVVRALRSRLVARWQRAPLEAGDAGEDPLSSLKPGLRRLGPLQTPLAGICSPGPALALLPPNCTRGRANKAKTAASRRARGPWPGDDPAAPITLDVGTKLRPPDLSPGIQGVPTGLPGQGLPEGGPLCGQRLAPPTSRAEKRQTLSGPWGPSPQAAPAGQRAARGVRGAFHPPPSSPTFFVV